MKKLLKRFDGEQQVVKMLEKANAKIKELDWFKCPTEIYPHAFDPGSMHLVNSNTGLPNTAVSVMEYTSQFHMYVTSLKMLADIMELYASMVFCNINAKMHVNTMLVNEYGHRKAMETVGKPKKKFDYNKYFQKLVKRHVKDWSMTKDGKFFFDDFVHNMNYIDFESKNMAELYKTIKCPEEPKIDPMYGYIRTMIEKTIEMKKRRESKWSRTSIKLSLVLIMIRVLYEIRRPFVKLATGLRLLKVPYEEREEALKSEVDHRFASELSIDEDFYENASNKFIVALNTMKALKKTVNENCDRYFKMIEELKQMKDACDNMWKNIDFNYDMEKFFNRVEAVSKIFKSSIKNDRTLYGRVGDLVKDVSIARDIIYEAIFNIQMTSTHQFMRDEITL